MGEKIKDVDDRGVKKQYPDATQSVLQKAKYYEEEFECKKKIHNFYLKK